MATQTRTTISRKAADAFLTALENTGVTDEKLQEATRDGRAIRLIAEVIEAEDLSGAALSFYPSGYCR